VLSPPIREGNRVRSSHSSGSISRLSSIEVSLGVVISNSVMVGVGCGLFLLVISGSSMVCSGWGMVGGGRGMVGGGSMNYRGGMVCWGMMDNGSMMDYGGMMDRSSMISRSMVYNWCSMISRGRSMVGRGSMVSWSSMVRRGGSIAMSRQSSWGMHSSRVLLITAISMYRLWGSMGLADHRGMYSTMGLVDRVAH